MYGSEMQSTNLLHPTSEMLIPRAEAMPCLYFLRYLVASVHVIVWNEATPTNTMSLKLSLANHAPTIKNRKGLAQSTVTRR